MHCLASPTVSELTTATRIHLSNLSVLAFTELTLRASIHELNNMNKDFLYVSLTIHYRSWPRRNCWKFIIKILCRLFLSRNIFYDEVWAVDIAGQTCLWKVLHHLSTQRGLFAQVLAILIKALKSFNSNNSPFVSSQNKCMLDKQKSSCFVIS